MKWLASFPMYDLPAVRAATDSWWQGLAAHLRRAGVDAVPGRLSRDPVPAWSDPALLVSQTCGYPLTHELANRVQIVGTPIYDAPGCADGFYVSALVVAAASRAQTLADLRGGICAFSSPGSHSGYNVLRYMVAPRACDGAFFSEVIETGGHLTSLQSVAQGAADLCAVDAVTHALLARHEPEALDATRVLMFSPSAPGLPWIAGRRISAKARTRIHAGFKAALADPALASVRADLLLAGIANLPLDAYATIPEMESAARALGYPELR